MCAVVILYFRYTRDRVANGNEHVQILCAGGKKAAISTLTAYSLARVRALFLSRSNVPCALYFSSSFIRCGPLTSSDSSSPPQTTRYPTLRYLPSPRALHTIRISDRLSQVEFVYRAN